MRKYSSKNFQKHTSLNPLQKWAIKKLNTALLTLLCVNNSTETRLLDAGCGEGFTLDFIEQHYNKISIFGIDNKPKVIHMAKKHLKNTSLIIGSIYSLPFTDSFFNIVICLEVLEHLVYPQKALKELVRVSKRRVIISVPNEPYYEIIRFLTGKNITHLGYCDEHRQRWSRYEFRQLLSPFADKIFIITPPPYVWNIFYFDK